MRGDICDSELLATLVPGHDLVVNFAAETHVDRLYRRCCAVRGHQRGRGAIADAGLRGGQGAPRRPGIDRRGLRVHRYRLLAEAAPLDPNSPYSAAKAGGDMIAQAYHRTHGLNVVITRCCNNYGPYQYPEKVIPLFITNLLNGARVPLYGDGGNVREWIHVDDHCRGIQLAAQHRRRRAGVPHRR